MILVAAGNLEGQLSVSILTLVLTMVLPAVLLAAIVWVFWKASRTENSSGGDPEQ